MTIEPVTREQLRALRKCLGGPIAALVARIDDVDLSKGRGTIEAGREHCLWTKDRCRITVTVFPSGEGMLASVGKEPDPECPL